MTQKTPAQTIPEKEKPKQPAAQAKSTTAQELHPEKGTLKPEEAKVESASKPAPVKTMSLADVQKVVESLAKTIVEHSQQIAELHEALARKRKTVPNGKIQIKDKKTSKVYPSKNNCYQSLLKAGELKKLVDNGIFGDNPEKNTFGWYALVRALPDRFEEVMPEQSEEVKTEASKEQA